jgi:predicted phosphodiesterase
VYGTGSFVTAPDENAKSVKFLGFGDTRTNPVIMDQVIQEMRKVYAADPAFQSITLQAGDWVSSDAESSWTGQWFTANPQTVALLAETPINGVKGNHENSSGYSKFFPKYYPYPYLNAQAKAGDPLSLNNLSWSFNYGPVHFTVVDQYTEYCAKDQPNTACATTHADSAQYTWVKNDLAATTKPWKILVYHEPAWGPGTHQLNYKTQLALDPLIKQYKVDMVYSGHNHNYGRAQISNPAEAIVNTVVAGVNDTIAPNVQYVTVGGGGAPLYTVDLTNTGVCAPPTGDYLPGTCFRHVANGVSNFGYATFDVNDKTLTMKAYQIFKADGATQVINTANGPTTSSLIETVVLKHFTDVSSQISATTGNIVYSRATKLYSGNLTITNNGADITGNVDAALNNLTTGVTLSNATAYYQGVPYVTVSTSGLAAGASITVPVTFSNPANAKINFTPVTFQE